MKIKLKGKIYKIEIFEEDKLIGVKVNDKEYTFSFGATGKLALKKDKQKNEEYLKEFVETSSSKKQIESPLAGEVSKIFVKIGEKVKIDQPLVAIFSMKMENEITSSVESSVKEIKVKEGDNVETEQVLIVLK